MNLRRSIWSIDQHQVFFYKEVMEWAKEERTKTDYCYIEEFSLQKTCQEMLAYCLLKAMDDPPARLGPYNSSSWALKNVNSVRYEHPLGMTPLRSLFEETRVEEGGRRTPKMQKSSHHDKNSLFEATWGSVFRSVFDLSEPTSAYFSIDSELN